ncbi:hypothetical protein E4U42_007587 [Claviceps africana]|uniref:Uncharacterized protein n=1 Tax=Claviceps africana TaxID=83212 RepID=A0A8K0JB98_9HYPO|nr:hypothetical protein E4U42_007587 [Claviceps africana]
MDTIAIQEACMADLGRQRQDELPLSGKEGKRPSYEPGRGNGAGHYAPSLKKDLESKWKVQIQDEESEEMQGLALGDSRPWAKITESYMNRHRADTAPPVLQPASQRRRRPANQTANEAVRRPGGLEPPRRVVVRLPSPAQQPRTIREPEARLVKAPETTRTETALPIRPSPLASEQLIYRELCKWLDAESKGPLFVVTCSLKIQKNSDKAFLVLSAPKKQDRLHNVLNISEPDIQDDCCSFFSREIESRRKHILQFPNASGANKFGLYLENLQKAAARAHGTSSKASDNQSRQIDIPSSAKLKPSTKENTKKESTSSASKPETSGIRDTKLVDVESAATTSEQEENAPTIEDAAESLFDLIEKILPEAAAAGLNVSEDAISDIQETAIESWLRRGFLKSEADDIKSELLELLRILVRIKRKAELRKKAAQPKSPIVISSLKDFESADSNVKRIKYSAAEIRSLSSGSTAVPTGPDKSALTPRRTQPTGSYSAAAAAQAMSKNKAWLDGGSAVQRPDATTATPPMSHEKSRSVMNNVCPEVLKAANKGGVSPPQSPSAVKGLSSSR